MCLLLDLLANFTAVLTACQYSWRENARLMFLRGYTINYNILLCKWVPGLFLYARQNKVYKQTIYRQTRYNTAMRGIYL